MSIYFHWHCFHKTGDYVVTRRHGKFDAEEQQEEVCCKCAKSQPHRIPSCPIEPFA